MKVKLVVIGGKKDGMEIAVSTPKFMIGRGQQCHIRPQSSLIGELHCVLSVDGNSVNLEDCGGAVGTLVNGRRVQQRQRLQDNDRIKVASLEFCVRLLDDKPAAKQVSDATVARGEVSAPKPATPATKEEADILQWVKQEEKIRTSPAEVVTLQYAKPEEKPEEQAPVVEPPKKAVAVAEEAWEFTDVCLVLTAVPLVGVLLSFLPTYWIWRSVAGIVLLALAWAFRTHTRRTQGIRLDELNITVGILALLVISLMVPAYWVWPGGGLILLVAFSCVVAVRMDRLTDNRLDDTNVALLAAISLFAFIVAPPLTSSPFFGWFGVSILGIVAAILVLGLRTRRMTGIWLDDTNAALLAVLGLLVFVLLKQSSTTDWIQMTGALVSMATFAALFGIRARRMTGNRLDGLNLLLLLQMGIVGVTVLHVAIYNPKVWQVGAAVLLAVSVLLLVIGLVWSNGKKLTEANLALLTQTIVMAIYVGNWWLPAEMRPATLWRSTLSAFGASPAEPAAVLAIESAAGRASKRAKAEMPAGKVVPAKAEAAKQPAAEGHDKPQPKAAEVKPPAKVPPAKVEADKLPPAKAVVPVKVELAQAAADANPPADKAPVAKAPPAKAADAKPPAKAPPARPKTRIARKIIPVKSASPVNWWRLGSTFVPLGVLISLFGVRTRRMTGNRLDGLNLLLLSQIVILTISALHLAVPGVGVWRWGTVAILVVLIPLFCIGVTRRDSAKLTEVELAFLTQLAILGLFVTSYWLPYAWMRPLTIVLLVAALVPLFALRKLWMKSGKPSEINFLLLVQAGLFALVIADRWFPSFWVRIGGVAFLALALATMLRLHKKQTAVGRSDGVLLRFAALGVLLLVVLGYLFPIQSWWPA